MATEPVIAAIGQLAGNITSYALVLAGVGTITMALIELLKGVFDLRMHFNRGRIEKWLSDDRTVSQLELLAAGSGAPQGRFRPLSGFATGEIRRADVLYDQPIEKLMGQIQAAANIALDFPWRYEQLFRFLAVPPGTKDEEDDAGRWLKYAKAVADGKKPEAADGRAATQARARIGNLVARKLDSFQNEQQYFWAELNQRVAVTGGAVLLFGLLVATKPGLSMPAAAALSILGGLAAPFAKDVVSALSGLSAKAK